MEKINFLLNANNHAYNFSDSEFQALNEAKILLEKSYFLYALYEVYNMILAHLLRRIEYFGVEDFLSDLQTTAIYQDNETILYKRWEQFDTKEIFQHAFKHNIVDAITLDLLFALYHSKHTLQDNSFISVEYISSFLTLFEHRLFQKEFIKAPLKFNRRKSDQNSHQRRKEDSNFDSVSKDEEIRIKVGINPFKAPLQEPINTVEKYG